MFLTEGSSILNILLIIIGLAVSWTILKAIFRITIRLFITGLVILLILVIAGAVMGWIG